MKRLDFTHAIYKRAEQQWKLFGLYDDGSVKLLTTGSFKKIKSHDDSLVKIKDEMIVTDARKDLK